MDINNRQFLTQLRSALHHLYNLDELRRSPLAEWFGIAGRVDTAPALQKILLDKIEAIRPGDDESPQSNAWMIYDILFFRYVRGYEREAVARQLGISDRQLSRKLAAALETLAFELWKTYHLESSQETILEKESTWIENLPPELNAAWKPILLSVLEMLNSLIVEHKVTVQYSPDAVPDLLVPQRALRYALLNILGRIIPLSPHAVVKITPTVSDHMLNIAIIIPQSQGNQPISADTIFLDQNIAVARQFVERARGKLDMTCDGDGVRITFNVPALELIPVLVIDDNVDTLQLFQRYAQGSPYSVVGAQDPVEGYALIEKIKPRIIVMDVMMPNQDGWDLLTRLRQDRRIVEQLGQPYAIIMCSILPQEALARSLGADGFLQKPVLPQDFLLALDRQMSLFGTA